MNNQPGAAPVDDDQPGPLINLNNALIARHALFPENSLVTYPVDGNALTLPLGEFDWDEIDALPVEDDQ